jgi:hypothetical protein
MHLPIPTTSISFDEIYKLQEEVHGAIVRWKLEGVLAKLDLT